MAPKSRCPVGHRGQLLNCYMNISPYYLGDKFTLTGKEASNVEGYHCVTSFPPSLPLKPQFGHLRSQNSLLWLEICPHTLSPQKFRSLTPPYIPFRPYELVKIQAYFIRNPLFSFLCSYCHNSQGSCHNSKDLITIQRFLSQLKVKAQCHNSKDSDITQRILSQFKRSYHNSKSKRNVTTQRILT